MLSFIQAMKIKNINNSRYVNDGKYENSIKCGDGIVQSSIVEWDQEIKMVQWW